MKVWTTEEIRTLLEQNDKAVTRAVVALYKRQTSAEQSSAITREANGVGFNSYDASYLTFCAEWALKTGRMISGKHMQRARKAVLKYARQLSDIANEPYAKQYAQEEAASANGKQPECHYGEW